MNWRTLYRFWPIVPYYGRRIIAKAAPRFLPVGGTSLGLPLYLRLWREEAVRELLEPSRMRASAVLDRDSLDGFLKRSQSPGFQNEEEWLRLLGLEYTLQTIESARRISICREVLSP
jgi:hypothetical protein